jgi:uncharacterized protein YyaL (SSP411 family)
MIGALSKAGRVLDKPQFVNLAKKAADFFLGQMIENGLLYHRFAKSEKAVEGFLDDYASLTFGLTELYEATFEDRYLQAAVKMTDSMVKKFWDEKEGGFFFTSNTSESAMPRMKQVYDGAVPSGNSVAMMNLIRLARLVNNETYETLANQVSKAFSDEVHGAPDAYTYLLAALDFALGPSYSVSLVGETAEKDLQAMTAALHANYLPEVVISIVSPDKTGLGYEKLNGRATAYVCREKICLPATNSPKRMLELLGIA